MQAGHVELAELVGKVGIVGSLFLVVEPSHPTFCWQLHQPFNFLVLLPQN